MKKSFTAIILSLSILMGCSKGKLPDPFLIEGISRDESGICYSLYYYNRFFMQPGLVKQLAVDGIVPTSQAIRDRTYLYTTEVYTAIRADTGKNSNAYRLYRLLCSDKAKTIIAESGYVPK